MARIEQHQRILAPMPRADTIHGGDYPKLRKIPGQAMDADAMTEPFTPRRKFRFLPGDYPIVTGISVIVSLPKMSMTFTATV